MKLFFAALAVTILCIVYGAPAEAEGPLAFSTIMEALESAGEDFITGSDEDHSIVVVKKDGKYIRVVADLDEKALELNDAMFDAEDFDAAYESFNEYIKTLPVLYTEELTASAKSQEDLDKLIGCSIAELKAEGYEYSSVGSGDNDEVVITMAYGFYDYDFVINETEDEYLAQDDIDEMTVKSVKLAGASYNTLDLRYLADGTVDPEVEYLEEYTEMLGQLSNLVTEASENGTFDMNAIINELITAYPDLEDRIPEFVQEYMNADSVG